ncbi:MAG: ribonuclease HI family protein [Myxococcaceae bacterium]
MTSVLLDERTADLPPVPSGVLRVFTDGAARGNPGLAGAGAVVVNSEGDILARVGKFLGTQTNNYAEYTAALVGLREARRLGAKSVELVADSQLVIRQLAGRYKVKNAGLKPLHAEAIALLKQFESVRLVHVPRELNPDADEMSNRAIDERL